MPARSTPPLASARLRLRPVGPDDVEAILALWNDPGVRRMHGLGTQPLGPASVRRWLDDPERAHAWLARTPAGAPVGLIEMAPLDAGADADADAAMAKGVAFELGIAVERGRRGHGYGREMVEAACAWAFGQAGAARVRAEVLTRNLPARRLFAAAGFVQTGRDGAVLHLERRQRPALDAAAGPAAVQRTDGRDPDDAGRP